MSRSDRAVPSRDVLVIDDDLPLRALFETLLSRKGFVVDSAADGRDAVDQISRHDYSVILLDLMMPNVNGFELLESLERDSPSLLPRVIVLSGVNQRMLARVDRTKVFDLIRKPFDIDHLVSRTIACADGQRKV